MTSGAFDSSTSRQPQPQCGQQTSATEREDRHRRLAEAFEVYRLRLRRMLAMRIDGRLRNRLDASDIIQETFVRAAQQPCSYEPATEAPGYLWLRQLALWTLGDLQRKHLGVQARNPRRERSIDEPWQPSVGSAGLAELLLDSMTSPTKAVERAERAVLVQQAFQQLDPIDREVVCLRHGEQLSRAETAEVLGISIEAAAKRYVRAITRCRALMRKLGLGTE